MEKVNKFDCSKYLKKMKIRPCRSIVRTLLCFDKYFKNWKFPLKSCWIKEEDWVCSSRWISFPYRQFLVFYMRRPTSYSIRHWDFLQTQMVALFSNRTSTNRFALISLLLITIYIYHVTCDRYSIFAAMHAASDEFFFAPFV